MRSECGRTCSTVWITKRPACFERTLAHVGSFFAQLARYLAGLVDRDDDWQPDLGSIIRLIGQSERTERMLHVRTYFRLIVF